MTGGSTAVFFMCGSICFLLILVLGFDVHPYTAAVLLFGFVSGSFIYTFLRSKWIIPQLTLQQKAILLDFDFYKTLTLKEKMEFERRVSYLIENKEFMGRNHLVVTDRMRVLIAATIAQIGFGFKFITFEDFDKIIIFPKAYYSKHTGRYHKGEVNSAGVVVLSWTDFLEGYRISDDGYNVGLHEFAHALRLEDALPGDEYHFLKAADLELWNRVAETEYERIRNGNPSFIRSYAGTNRQEFFAVCIEQFFEQPEAFNQALPELYKALAQLIKQDPLKRKRNYF